MISSIFSRPIESLTVVFLMPWSSSSSSVSCEWVVDAGWITNDLASATFAKSEKISRLSMKSLVFFSSPLMSNVKIEPPPLGKYFLYNSFCFGSSVASGWLTFSTCGWFFKYSTTLAAFSVCLSTRSESVSSPCKKKNAWNGDKVAPVSLSKIALIFVTNAAAPTAFVKLIPW